MRKTLNFGIVGYGSIAEHHIKSIQALEDCALLAVTSSNPEKRKQIVEKYQVQAFATVEEMVALEALDVVCICTPNGFHLEPCLAAAKAGKHIITEKPLEINVDRCQQMIDACEEAGVILSCIFQNRYIPGYQKVLELVKGGHLGQLILANAYVKWFRSPEYYANNGWRGTLKGDGGAALITQSIHYIDQLINLMGPVKSVIGKTKTLYHKIEGEDIGTAILEFENGAIGTIEGSTAIYAGFPEKLEVHGTEGSLVLEAGEIVEAKFKSDVALDLNQASGTTSASSNPNAVDVALHIEQFKHIVEAIRSNVQPEVNGHEAIKSIRVLNAIYESSKTKKEVTL